VTEAVSPGSSFSIRWPLLALGACLSVLTAPITAGFLLLIAPLTMFVGLALHARGRKAGSTVSSVGVGLFVGPFVYLGLALTYAL
jgi:hypothetical protein